MKFPYNLHIHSIKSRCAKPEMTIKNIIERSAALGFKLIGISDHVNTESQSAEFLLETKAEIDSLKPNLPLPVLVGCEVNQLSPTKMALADEIAAQLDYIIVATNHYHLKKVEQPAQLTPQGYARHHLDMLEGAIAWQYTNIIAHPFFPRLKYDQRADFDYSACETAIDRNRLFGLMKQAAENEIAFELNPHYHAKMPNIYLESIRMAREAGMKLAPGTDAHYLAGLDFGKFFPKLSTDQIEISLLGLNKETLFWPRNSIFTKE